MSKLLLFLFFIIISLFLSSALIIFRELFCRGYAMRYDADWSPNDYNFRSTEFILMTLSLHSFDLTFTAYKKALIQNLFALKKKYNFFLPILI